MCLELARDFKKYEIWSSEYSWNIPFSVASGDSVAAGFNSRYFGSNPNSHQSVFYYMGEEANV